MAARQSLSVKSAGVRRLLKEAAELKADECPDYDAGPTEEDLFEWHFTIKGPGGDYEGGIYHGKLILPAEYPFKPPEVYMMTPSGRFETNKKICLSISSFHPESWQPSWGIRTALIAIMAFFSSDPQGSVGSLDTPPEERRRLATLSRSFKCKGCTFDASTGIPGPPPPPIVEESVSSSEIEVTPQEVSTHQFEQPSELPPPTTIFPSSSASNPSTPNINNGGRVMNVPTPMPRPLEGANPNPVPVMVAPPAAAPGLEVMIGAEGFSQEGGQPLVVDRVILAVLILLISLIVRKLA